MTDHSDLDSNEDRRRDAAFAARKSKAISVARWLGFAWFFVAIVIALAAGKSLFLLEPNAWGDFLAGVFAPAAFIGVITTVWLQSIELEAQREELKQTRREFTLNRKVLEEQAKYIGKQTEILNAQEGARQQDRAEAAIETFLDLLTLNLIDIMTAGRPIRGNDPSTTFSRTDGSLPPGSRPSSIFPRLATALVEQVGHYRRFGPISVPNIDSVRAARQRLQPCLDMLPELAPSAKIRVHSELQLQLAESLDRILSDHEKGASNAG